MRRLVVACALLAACARTTYLGARLPEACERSIVVCRSELRLREYADRYVPARASLTAYVTGVARRIARVSTLERTPRVLILPEGDAAVVGDTITIGHRLLVKLGSEAELAGILAHEIVHLEEKLSAGYEHDIDNAQMQALEAVADERAVLLLELAGYPSYAMYDGMRFALHGDDDDRHPPRDVRLRHVAALVDRSSRLDDGRSRFVTALAGEPLDLDFTYGGPVGDKLVFPRSRVSLSLPAGVERTGLWRSLDGLHEASQRTYAAFSVGRRAGADLVAHLSDHRTMRTAVGTVHVGTSPAPPRGDLSPLERVLAYARLEMWGLGLDNAFAVLEREHEAILMVVSGKGAPKALAEWVPLLQRATDAERAAAVPARIVPKPVPRAGLAGELGRTCLDPRVVYIYEDEQRRLAAGDLLKCTDRPVH